MATYYVRNDGNDANTGLGSTTALAWRTVQKALGATGIGSGDTVYIAPGIYRENITIAGTYTAATYIIGDPTASQFPGVSQGLVRLTNYLTTDTALPSGTIIASGNKNFLNFSGLYFDGSAVMLNLQNSNNIVVENCAFIGTSLTASSGIQGSFSTGVTVNNTIRRCIFMTGYSGLYFEVGGGHTSDWSLGFTVQDCAFIGTSPVTASTPAIRFTRTTGAANLAGGINIYNCYIQSAVQGINFDCGNVTYPTNVRNCIITNCGTGINGRGTTTNIQDYNRIIGCSVNLSGVATGANTVTVGPLMVDIGMSQLFGLSAKQTWFSALPASLNIGFGDPTGALTTDLFGATWFNGGSDPDAGALTSIQLSGTSYYQPTERNASTVTIAPGSTSQSIELYLGATGLTASTSGLSARYNRTRTASVSIPLVARTIAQAWTAGGFAEVDATNMPGVYRLDLPDAALAAGADDVTVVVRGASGTNGAVMTIKLSSGGLTSAETASAVWGASPGPYNDATTMGGVVNQTDTLANDIDTNVNQIPILVWDELKSNHTTPGTFGDYLDAKVSDVADTARIQLRQGPFLIKQNAVDSVITEVNQFLSTVPNIEMVLIDSSGGSVSVAGATLVMRVRNQAGTAVVNNVTPAVAYADGGVIRWSPNLSWTALGVTTAGTYRIVVERTMSGVTTTFGPFLVQLSSG